MSLLKSRKRQTAGTLFSAGCWSVFAQAKTVREQGNFAPPRGTKLWDRKILHQQYFTLFPTRRQNPLLTKYCMLLSGNDIMVEILLRISLSIYSEDCPYRHRRQQKTLFRRISRSIALITLTTLQKAPPAACGQWVSACSKRKVGIYEAGINLRGFGKHLSGL